MRKCILALIGSILIVGVSFAADIKQEFQVAKGDRLTVNLKSGGSIDIRGWDKELAVVEVEFSRCDPDDFDFDISPSRSGLTIRSDYRRRVNRSNIAVRIMLPREFDLRLKTIGGGISIQDIKGIIRGSTAGGELDLAGLEGDIDLSTGGGEVIVRDSRVDGEVTTGGGKVLVENVKVILMPVRGAAMLSSKMSPHRRAIIHRDWSIFATPAAKSTWTTHPKARTSGRGEAIFTSVRRVILSRRAPGAAILRLRKSTAGWKPPPEPGTSRSP
jgi:hypothetical protein